MTPEEVRLKEFHQRLRGYDEDEVDAFLDEVEHELGRLIADNANLRERLAHGGGGGGTPTVTNIAASSETEEMLRRTLLLAQQSADETVATARAEAARLIEEARATAQHVVGDLEQRKQALEQQVEALRMFEREYRARLRAYLEAQLRDLDPAAAAPTPPPPPQAPARPATPPGAPPLGYPPLAPPTSGRA